MNMQVLDSRHDAGGGYKVDVTRGERVGRVSSEWFSRRDDERILSLGDLASAVRGRSERSRTRVVETALIHVEANRNDPERLALILPGADAPVTPTHWSFGQLASQVGAPAAYLRQLPAPLAAINLQYGLTSHRAEQIKTLETDDAIADAKCGFEWSPFQLHSKVWIILVMQIGQKHLQETESAQRETERQRERETERERQKIREREQ